MFHPQKTLHVQLMSQQYSQTGHKHESTDREGADQPPGLRCKELVNALRESKNGR